MAHSCSVERMFLLLLFSSLIFCFQKFFQLQFKAKGCILISFKLVKNTIFVSALTCLGWLPVVAYGNDTDIKYQNLKNRASESLGARYEAPIKIKSQLARVTVYRLAESRSVGVAHLRVNGQYHTSLQPGGFSELCVMPQLLQLATYMSRTGVDHKGYQFTTTLDLQEEKNIFVRVVDLGDGHSTFTLVSTESAYQELQGIRRQTHAVTRVAITQECVDVGQGNVQ